MVFDVFRIPEREEGVTAGFWKLAPSADAFPTCTCYANIHQKSLGNGTVAGRVW